MAFTSTQTKQSHIDSCDIHITKQDVNMQEISHTFSELLF